MKKLFISLLSIIFILLSCASCTKSESSDIVVSFYALRELTENLVKDTDLKVDTLISGTSEPHDFEISARGVQKLYDSKLIIFNGYNLEEFESSLDGELKSKVLHASKDVEAVYVNKTEDPHTFASPKSLKIMLNTIKESLIETFSDKKDTIILNYNTYYNLLDEVDTLYTNFFETTNKKIITGHEAFNYVSRDYNYEFKAVNGINEEEPTAKKIEEIQNYIKDNNINTIYGEEFEENETIENIARECNIKTENLYTLEMMSENGLSLIEALKNNINILKK